VDLKLYLQFKLAETDARVAQDKIYMIEAKSAEAMKKQSDAQHEADEQARIARQKAAVYDGLDGGVWTFKQVIPGLVRNHTRTTLEIHGHEIEGYSSDDLNARRMVWHAIFASRQFQVTLTDTPPFIITISDDGQSIAMEAVHSDGPKYRYVYHRDN
jgi:hypothetical protein